MKKIGCKKIPVVLVDYQSPNIRVIRMVRRGRDKKRLVIHRALSKKRMPSNVSKHMFILNNE
ncbi:MAG: hypothetical protein AB1502_11485 [Thermodesulfobacteriota bacterium]